MSSSSCRSLNSPYLTLQLNLANPSGSLQQRTVQMTVSEFQVRVLYIYPVECSRVWRNIISLSLLQNFAGQLKDMASALETAA